ncbi:MAG TPA: rod shape-determining protein MreD [Candidatus Acidoferrales bacterium]|nr:rod shape-determining protein MreD [Candidatus Acidoferrales bacterium]
MRHSASPKRHEAPFVGPPWHAAVLWLLGAVILQSTLVHYLAFRNVVPSLVLVVVVWYAIRADPRRAAIFGLAAGLCEDVLSAQTGAAWTISTAVTATATSVLSRGFFADSVPLVAVITAVATLLRALLFWTTMGFEGYPPGLATQHFHDALLQAALNVGTIVVAMLVARRFDVQRA